MTHPTPPENGNGDVKRWTTVEMIWKSLVVMSLIVSATFFLLDRLQNAPLSDRITASQAKQDADLDALRVMCTETKGEMTILKNRIDALFVQLQSVTDRQGTVRETLAALKQQVEEHERRDERIYQHKVH